MTLMIIFALVYLIISPGLVFLIHLLHKRFLIQKKSEKLKKKGIRKPELPKPLWPRIMRHFKFSLSDKRPLTIAKKDLRIQNRFITWGILGLGLALSLWAAYSNQYMNIFYGVLLFYVALTFGLITSKKIIKKRDKIIQKMFDIAQSKLGESKEFSENPNAVVQVLEWRDPVTPSKVQFHIPTTFNGESGEEGFLKQFNQAFGSKTAWVPDADLEKGVSGWNYEDEIVVLREVPPLPQKAAWSEHYVLGEGIAWSFFPIGLAVENGVELPNPETGEIENVIGFDVAGEQSKVAKAAGLNMSSKIAMASPQALVGGSTGGGKSLDVETPVQVIYSASNKDN